MKDIDIKKIRYSNAEHHNKNEFFACPVKFKRLRMRVGFSYSCIEITSKIPSRTVSYNGQLKT